MTQPAHLPALWRPGPCSIGLQADTVGEMTGRHLLLVLCCLLAACGQGQPRDAFVDTRLPPGLATRFFPPEGWAWGLVQTGDYPAQRYGVSSPRNAPIAHILILPGYGESAETWFETAGELNARGYAVWVLEAAGQGGSGRYSVAADTGHIPDPEADLQAIRAMIRASLPQDRKPLILVGSQSGGILAILAASDRSGAKRLVLSALPPPSQVTSMETGLTRLGLGWLRDPRQGGWRRTQTPLRGADPYRGSLAHDWQVANPDLRMAAPSIGWRVVMAQAGSDAAKRLASIDLPVLMIDSGLPFEGACKRAPRCRALRIADTASDVPGHLLVDRSRSQWIKAIDGFVQQEPELSPRSGPPPRIDEP